jgi:hypothetical protein
MDGPFNTLCTMAFQKAIEFCQTDGLTFWLAVCSVIYFYEIIVGASEIISKEESRLLNGGWWIRQIFIQGLTFVFVTLGVGLAQKVANGSLAAFGDVIANIGKSWSEASQAYNNAAATNTALQLGHQTITQVVTASVLEVMSDQITIALTTIIGAICLLFVVFQAYLALGCSAIACCLGPICLPFGASTATEDVAKSWLKTWLVYSVLYMPMLAWALDLAQTIMVTNLALVFNPSYSGDFGVFEAVINKLAAPFATLGMVMAVPHLLGKAVR